MVETMPGWALSLSYWLHMLATVVWLGGLAAITLLLVPSAHHLPGTDAQIPLLATALRRLDPIAWFCLLVLGGTGLMQMTASSHYQGFLAVTNAWGVAIFLKHLVFFGMASVSGYLTWGVLPALHRALLRQSQGKSAPTLAGLHKRSLWLLRLNLGLGLVVLAFTAIARAA